MCTAYCQSYEFKSQLHLPHIIPEFIAFSYILERTTSRLLASSFFPNEWTSTFDLVLIKRQANWLDVRLCLISCHFFHCLTCGRRSVEDRFIADDLQANCGRQTAVVRRTLTNVPDVISVGMIWETDEPTADFVRSFVRIIDTQLKLTDVSLNRYIGTLYTLFVVGNSDLLHVGFRHSFAVHVCYYLASRFATSQRSRISCFFIYIYGNNFQSACLSLISA